MRTMRHVHQQGTGWAVGQRVCCVLLPLPQAALPLPLPVGRVSTQGAEWSAAQLRWLQRSAPPRGPSPEIQGAVVPLGLPPASPTLTWCPQWSHINVSRPCTKAHWRHSQSLEMELQHTLTGEAEKYVVSFPSHHFHYQNGHGKVVWYVLANSSQIAAWSRVGQKMHKPWRNESHV